MTSPTDLAREHVVQVINDGWLCLALSFGARLGLLDQLVADGPLTAPALARRAGVTTRHTEDWLWALVAAGIVANSTTDDGRPEFNLREGYAEATTAVGGPNNWSRIAEQLTTMARLEDDVVAAARSGDGLAATTYEGRLVDVLALESGPILKVTLLEEVVPALQVNDLLQSGGRVLDLGCGSGEALAILAANYPHSSFVGVDQSADAVALARRRAQADGLANLEFAVADLEQEWPHETPASWAREPVDVVLAVNVAHDMSDPEQFLRRARQTLRPGGVLALMELGFSDQMSENVCHEHAIGVLVFGLYHCLPLAQRRPGLAPGGMWGTSTYVSCAQRAGFEHVRVHRAPSDLTNDLIIATTTGDRDHS